MKSLSYLFLILLITLPNAALGKSSESNDQQTIYLALDAIPYSLVKEMYDAGQIKGYSEPRLVISAFPSTTTSGFTGLMQPLGVDKALGYDAIYYSYDDGKVKGSLLTALKENYNDYERLFDYYRHSFLQKFLIYVAPGVAVQSDLNRLQNIIWDNPSKKNIFFYIGGTDGTAHVLGRKRHKRTMSHVLSRLDLILKRYQREFGRELKVVLFSDHGFHYRHLKGMKTSHLEKMLKEKGYKLSKQLNGNGDVVVTEWGNISGASFYTQPENTEEVARILNNLPGNDLTFYKARGPDSIHVLSSDKGEARIDFDSKGTRFRYVELNGDPLQYHETILKMKKAGKMGRDNFARDRDWFQNTAYHYYPDALHRIYDGFYSLVKNPATILCSTRDDYEFGDPVTRFSSKLHGGLKGTHGGIFFTSSEAFVMTNIPGLTFPSVMRYSDVFEIIKSPHPPFEKGGQGEI